MTWNSYENRLHRSWPLLDYWMDMTAAHDLAYQPDSDQAARICISKCNNDKDVLGPCRRMRFGRPPAGATAARHRA